MPEIEYQTTLDGITASDLEGFFIGWHNPPPLDRRLEILSSASEVIVACDAGGTVVGFATAISDGTFAAYIPLVEVLPAHQGAGIGTEIVRRLLERLAGCYMIDVVCDPDVVSFYERLGGHQLSAVVWRNYDRLDPAGRRRDL
jgi:ribosomal protein S18 acetylase RimI-like enzyme